MTDQPKILKGVTESVLEASKARLKLAMSLQPPSYSSLDTLLSISDKLSSFSNLGMNPQVLSHPSFEMLSKLGESVQSLSYFPPDVLASISKLGTNLQPLSYASLDMVSNIGLGFQLPSSPSLDLALNLSKIGMSLQQPPYPSLDMLANISKLEMDSNLSSFRTIAESAKAISKGIGIQTSSFRTIFDVALAQSKSLELSLIPLAKSLSDAVIQDNLRTKSGKLKPISQFTIATEAIGIIAGVRNSKSLQNAATQLGQKLKQKPVSIQFTQIVKQSKQDILNQKSLLDVKNNFIVKAFEFLVNKKQVINNLTFFITVILLYYTLFVEIPISKESLKISKESLQQTEIQTSATLLSVASEREVRRNVKVKSKPGTGNTISELHPGDIVKLISFKANYALVIFVDSKRVAGQKGWVSRSALRLKKPFK